MLGVKQQAVSNWLNREVEIPYFKVIQIVCLTRGEITLEELAPYNKDQNLAIYQIAAILHQTNLIPYDLIDNDVAYLEYLNARGTHKDQFGRKMPDNQQGNNIMRDYAKVSSRFWSEFVDKNMREVGPDVILISLYVQTCRHANMIGIYHLPIP